MSTTQTCPGIAWRGTHYSSSPNFRLLEVAVLVDGTYSQSTTPSIDLQPVLAAQNLIQTISALKGGLLLQDANDGTNRYTAPNANISVSGTTLTFKVASGATDGGTGGTELSNGTAIHHLFSFLVAMVLA